MPNNKGRHAPSSARVAIACLFASLLCASAYISIPLSIGPVPIAFGNFFAILGALLLGPIGGGLASTIYIAIGALGFPVFSGGRGGLAHLVGPTGGYLLGYILGALVAGFLARKRSVLATISGALIGFLTILASGAIGLRAISGVDWSKALAIGILPFVPGDIVKAALAAAIALRLSPFVDSLISSGGATDA
jgi:biotin transport system substrate-specific component